MSLQSAVTELLGACPGAVGAAIVDPDGIPVVIQPREAALEEAGAELALVVRDVERAERELDHGRLQQLTVRSDRTVLVVTLMNAGYCLLLQMEPGGLIGKGRFLSRVTGEKLYSEFI